MMSYRWCWGLGAGTGCCGNPQVLRAGCSTNVPSTLTQHPAPSTRSFSAPELHTLALAEGEEDTMADRKDEVPSEPERNFEENVSEIGTDPNAEFDKDLNPVDYPAKPRPADDDIRQSER